MGIDKQTLLDDSINALKIISNSKITKTINLADIAFITPFLITPITAFIKSEGTDSKIIEPSNGDVRTYLKTIHFPNCIDAHRLDNLNCRTYLPLYQFSRGDKEYDKIISKIFGKIISFYGLESNKNIMVLFLSELIDNIREHSKSELNFIYSQKYTGMLAISIVDSGISIPSSYKSKNFKFEDDIEALKYALEGKSTKSEDERGTGIPNTVNLVCKGLKGGLILISKGVGFYKANEKELMFFKLRDMSFKGTIVNILFEIPKKQINYTKYINI